MDINDIISRIKAEQPQNLMAGNFDIDRFNALSEDDKARALLIINSGLQNPDSQVGAYAMSATDYETFDWLLGPIIRGYHGVDEDFIQTPNWDLNGDFDLAQIDPSLKNVSMRVRVARNTAEFPLPGLMTKADRVGFENMMVEVFTKLSSDPRFGGRYVSLTPGSTHAISQTEYQDLVSAHKMFKDMSADPYLISAGISRDWPYGRGMWESDNGQMIVWVNEEDQLRIMSMVTGSDLAVVFENLKGLLIAIEENGIKFAISKKYGYVTSCPSNIGTGMRASVHINLPQLVKKEALLKSIAKSHGLSVRGAGGEHTAYGESGLVDISPRARLGITEAQILSSLYEGIKQMLDEENKAQ